jgi:hypothetical protein
MARHSNESSTFTSRTINSLHHCTCPACQSEVFSPMHHSFEGINEHCSCPACCSLPSSPASSTSLTPSTSLPPRLSISPMMVGHDTGMISPVSPHLGAHSPVGYHTPMVRRPLTPTSHPRSAMTVATSMSRSLSHTGSANSRRSHTAKPHSLSSSPLNEPQTPIESFHSMFWKSSDRSRAISSPTLPVRSATTRRPLSSSAVPTPRQRPSSASKQFLPPGYDPKASVDFGFLAPVSRG